MKLILGLVFLTSCTYEIYNEVPMAAARNDDEEILTGWSNSGKLLTGRGISNTGRGIKLQAELDHDESITTQFNLSGAENLNANCRAEIISSVKGNRVRRLITVVDGASITTRGRAIDVTVRDFTDPALSTGVQYTVSILSTLGVRANNKQPPFLSPLFYTGVIGGPPTIITRNIVVPAGEARQIPVPGDAGVISVYNTVCAPSGAVVATEDELVLDLLVPSGSSYRNYDPRNFPDWVPLTPNTTNIQLTNFSAVGYEWMATFGIDG